MMNQTMKWVDRSKRNKIHRNQYITLETLKETKIQFTPFNSFFRVVRGPLAIGWDLIMTTKLYVSRPEILILLDLEGHLLLYLNFLVHPEFSGLAAKCN